MKGAITEIFFVFVLFLLVGASVLWVMTDSSNMLTTALNNTHIVPNATMANVKSVASNYNDFNFLLPLLVNGAALASVVLSLFLDSDPRYFSPAIIILIVLIFVSFYLSNTFMQIAKQPALIKTASSFPLVSFMIIELPYEIMLWTGLYIIGVALKKRQM